MITKNQLTLFQDLDANLKQQLVSICNDPQLPIKMRWKARGLVCMFKSFRQHFYSLDDDEDKAPSLNGFKSHVMTFYDSDDCYFLDLRYIQFKNTEELAYKQAIIELVEEVQQLKQSKVVKESQDTQEPLYYVDENDQQKQIEFKQAQLAQFEQMQEWPLSPVDERKQQKDIVSSLEHQSDKESMEVEENSEIDEKDFKQFLKGMLVSIGNFKKAKCNQKCYQCSLCTNKCCRKKCTCYQPGGQQKYPHACYTCNGCTKTQVKACYCHQKKCSCNK